MSSHCSMSLWNTRRPLKPLVAISQETWALSVDCPPNVVCETREKKGFCLETTLYWIVCEDAKLHVEVTAGSLHCFESYKGDCIHHLQYVFPVFIKLNTDLAHCLNYYTDNLHRIISHENVNKVKLTLFLNFFSHENKQLHKADTLNCYCKKLSFINVHDFELKMSSVDFFPCVQTSDSSNCAGTLHPLRTNSKIKVLTLMLDICCLGGTTTARTVPKISLSHSKWCLSLTVTTSWKWFIVFLKYK